MAPCNVSEGQFLKQIKHLSLPCSANGDTTSTRKKQRTLRPSLFVKHSSIEPPHFLQFDCCMAAGTHQSQRFPFPRHFREAYSGIVDGMASSPDVDNSPSSNAFVGIVVKPSPARHTKDNYSTGSRALQLVVGGRLEALRYLPVCSSATRRKPQPFWKLNYLRPLRCRLGVSETLHNCGRRFEEMKLIPRTQRRSVVVHGLGMFNRCFQAFAARKYLDGDTNKRNCCCTSMFRATRPSTCSTDSPSTAPT